MKRLIAKRDLNEQKIIEWLMEDRDIDEDTATRIWKSVYAELLEVEASGATKENLDKMWKIVEDKLYGIRFLLISPILNKMAEKVRREEKVRRNERSKMDEEQLAIADMRVVMSKFFAFKDALEKVLNKYNLERYDNNMDGYNQKLAETNTGRAIDTICEYSNAIWDESDLFV